MRWGATPVAYFTPKKTNFAEDRSASVSCRIADPHEGAESLDYSLYLEVAGIFLRMLSRAIQRHGPCRLEQCKWLKYQPVKRTVASLTRLVAEVPFLPLRVFLIEHTLARRGSNIQPRQVRADWFF